jgi:hypothetical protein
MTAYFFWDIENVSFHNLESIMARVNSVGCVAACYVVFSRIKGARKAILIENGWILIETGAISKNSSDNKIKLMLEEILADSKNDIEKIFLITEDKGFSRISKKIIQKGIPLEIICGTKNPAWIQQL